MKSKIFRTVAVAACVATGGLAAVQAQTLTPGASALNPVGPFLMRFDESFSATITIGPSGLPVALTGILAADPSVPPVVGVPLVLTFMLPEPVISGDVRILESAGGPVSDWLRFTDATGVINGGGTGTGSRMIFYSDLSDTDLNPDPADRPFPANLGTGLTATIVEVGPEGNNGFDYRPGGVAYPLNNEYVGISDTPPIPEPETFALMMVGLGAVGFMAKRRRARS